jgi:hypothetical protein
MAYAMRHPEVEKRGRGNKSPEPMNLQPRISEARFVLHLSHQFEAPKIAEAVVAAGYVMSRYFLNFPVARATVNCSVNQLLCACISCSTLFGS